MDARRHLLRVASGLCLILLWWATSALYGDPAFLPGPWSVFRQMGLIMTSGDFFFHMGHTLFRVVAGFLLAFLTGAAIGVAMGVSRTAETFFEVEVLVGLSIPGLAWAFIGVLLFGTKDLAPIFAIFLIILPMITVNVWEGTKALDRGLIEMGLSFRASRALLVRRIVLPHLLPYLFAATRFGFALAWKVVVLSEVFGLSNGIGFMLHTAFENFAIEGVLAWTLSFSLVMFTLEFGLVKILERRLTRWRPAVSLGTAA